MSWQQVVEQTIVGLGYELVDLHRSAGGLLRVTIDWPWDGAHAEQRFITIEDCERVTRQLQYVLEVEAVDYRRLEVASPGIDRPLRHERDYERFVGEVVQVVLRAPIGQAAKGAVAPARKKFRGILRRGDAAGAWQLELIADAAAKPTDKKGRRAAAPAAASQVLRFTLDEVREARLAPIVDFNGRRPRGGTHNAQATCRQ